MQTADVLSQHIVIVPGLVGGKPHVQGRRITVQQIANWHERMALSPDEIATAYDLSLGDVYAALAYYHDHREAIDAAIRDDATLVAAMRSHIPSKLNKPGRE